MEPERLEIDLPAEADDADLREGQARANPHRLPPVGRAVLHHSASLPERWPRKFVQPDRRVSCLTAAMLPRIRREHDEANLPDAQCRLQGEGGVGRDQG
jgi:hypothetical protein